MRQGGSRQQCLFVLLSLVCLTHSGSLSPALLVVECRSSSFRITLRWVTECREVTIMFVPLRLLGERPEKQAGRQLPLSSGSIQRCVQRKTR